ncbi:uncharacterized protein TNCV_2254561 [Trichonephila clavipes]|nr:uncharacterized protein TNCV_2254561 [Trichonephila clavipes]
MCDIYGYSVHWLGYICSYCTPKIKYEWTVCPGTSSLCSSIRPIKRGTIKGGLEGHDGNWTVSDWGNVMFTDESRFALEPDAKRIRIWRKQGIHNQPQNITEHHAFRGGSIMVWAGISLGYCTDLHIFKWGSVTAVRYRDEVLEPIMRLYAEAIDPTWTITHVPIELTSSMTTLRVKGLRVWRGQHICPTLIPLKIFEMRSAVLYLHVSHLQLLLLSWKLIYKKNGDCLILRWLTT